MRKNHARGEGGALHPRRPAGALIHQDAIVTPASVTRHFDASARTHMPRALVSPALVALRLSWDSLAALPCFEAGSLHCDMGSSLGTVGLQASAAYALQNCSARDSKCNARRADLYGGATSSQMSIFKQTPLFNGSAMPSMHVYYGALVSAAVCRRDS